MNIQPQDGYILVKEIKKEKEKKKEGERDLILPDIYDANPLRVEVVSVCTQIKSPIEKETPMGTVVTYDLPNVKAGDIVYIRDAFNANVKEDGTKYLFVKYEDILGIEE